MTGAAAAAPAIEFREARAADMAEVQDIYAYHVATGLASFEEVAPDRAEMERRRVAVQAAGLPYLVALDGKRVVGFAYATPYRERSAYRYTAEDSIYMSPKSMRRGVGARLLDLLIERCTAAGYRQMVAVIGDSANIASIQLHERAGFSHAGTLHAVGRKFGRWVDTVIMQRPLGAGNRAAPE